MGIRTVRILSGQWINTRPGFRLNLFLPKVRQEMADLRGFDGDGGNRTRVKSLPKEVCGLRGDCVPWVGATNSSGYGARTINGGPWLAHRAAYVEAYGDIPADAQIDHVCEN